MLLARRRRASFPKGGVVFLTQVDRPVTAQVADIVALTKPRLSGLVVATAGVGVAVAPGHFPLTQGALFVFATTLLVGAANMLNSYMERHVDAHMVRTADRPLAAGRLDPRIALWLGIAGGVLMVPLLALVANVLTALLGAIAYLTYVLVYTPLKQRSSWALPVGAIPGALPPAMGITAVSGRLDAVAAVLFAILFVWQLPHFVSISLYLKDDYARGGLKVFALVHGERRSAIVIAVTAAALLPASLAASSVGLGRLVYAIVAVALGVAFFGLTAMGPFVENVQRWSRWVFRASLVYLVLLLAALSASAG
jgi:protoheme IX farnesyltransferase